MCLAPGLPKLGILCNTALLTLQREIARFRCVLICRCRGPLVTPCGALLRNPPFRVLPLDVEGRLIDFKTAARRPSCVSPNYAFQLATYRQITPGASGEVRIDSLVKTQTVQIVQQAYTVEKPDIRATQVLYPMAQKAMGSGMYCPNRQSLLCSQKHCSFWKQCEEEFGGRVRQS